MHGSNQNEVWKLTEGSFSSFIWSHDQWQRATACTGEQPHRCEHKPASYRRLIGSARERRFFPSTHRWEDKRFPNSHTSPSWKPHIPLCSPQARRQACPTHVRIARSILPLGVFLNAPDCSGNTPATVLFSNSWGRLNIANGKQIPLPQTPKRGKKKKSTDRRDREGRVSIAPKSF